MAFRPISLFLLSQSLQCTHSLSHPHTRTRRSTKQRKTVFLCPKNARLLYGKSCAKKIVVNFLQRRTPDCLLPAEPAQVGRTACDCLLGFLPAHISSCSHLSPPEVILIPNHAKLYFYAIFFPAKVAQRKATQKNFEAISRCRFQTLDLSDNER